MNIRGRGLRTFVFHDLRAFWFLVIREHIPHISPYIICSYTHICIYIYIYVPILPANNQQDSFWASGGMFRV